MTTPINNSLYKVFHSNDKFNSPEAYNAYLNNYNYLIKNNNDISSLYNDLQSLNNSMYSIISSDDYTLFDKYLTVDAYDTITGNINNPSYNELLKSTIMSEIQHNKMNKLNNTINKLPTQSNVNNNIKAIKNYGNSKILNVEKRMNYTDDKADKTDKYIIYGNNGCLSYDSSSSDSKYISPNGNSNNKDENYKRISFKPCNAKDTNQLFVMDNIASATDYNNYSNPDNTIPTFSTSETDVNTGLGYYFVRPVDNYKSEIKDKKDKINMCLNFDNSGLSVQPCDISINQKYSVINKHVM